MLYFKHTTCIGGGKCLKNFNSEQDNIDKHLLYIEFHIADHCNLNCKYCSHFSPIADKKFYEFNEFTKDISRLSEITNKNIDVIRIMGGEPLLNPKICKYLDTTRKYFPSSGIHLVSNGILLPSKSDDFWGNMSENNIHLDISSYPIDINAELIKNKATKYNIRLSFNSTVNQNSFEKMNLDLDATQKDLFHCRNCFTGSCLNLYEGKIYACPVIAYVKYFNKKYNKNIKVSSGDYIDIYKINNVNKIIDWIYKPKEFCKYCAPTTTVPWEASMEHDISEWV